MTGRGIRGTEPAGAGSAAARARGSAAAAIAYSPGSASGARLRRALPRAALLACVLGLLLLVVRGGGHGESAARHPPAAGSQVGLLASVSAGAGASAQRFWPLREGGSLLTAGGGIRGEFGRSGVTLRAAAGTLSLALAGVSRGGRVQPVSAVAPAPGAGSVAYRHGWLTETYRNGPLGLEQGFLIARRPLTGAGALGIVLRLGGSLAPTHSGATVLFRARGSRSALGYGGLRAFDASGRELPAGMAAGRGQLRLTVADAHARYPIRIDPFIQQGAALTGAGESGAGEFGASLALSADGATALVGAPGDGAGAGAAFVFTRTGSVWAQQGGKLTAGATESGAARFGGAVALSGDGNTAVIGGAGDAGGTGAAWVFTRSGGTWSEQPGKLTGAGESGPGRFGQAVALSADGATALIGGPGDEPVAQSSDGAAWVFVRSGETFAQQGAKLTGTGGIGPGRFGSSLALSADGSTALVGAPNNEYCIGGAWILQRSGEAWVRQALIRGHIQGTACDDGPDDGWSDENEFGQAVALSADGDLALVSEPYIDVLRQGETRVFARAGATWSELPPVQSPGRAKVGASALALSAGAGQALIGRLEPGGAHAALAFVRAGAEYAQEGWSGLPVAGPGAAATGEAVALSPDGSTGLAGGPAEAGSAGAVWAFAMSPALGPPGVSTLPASAVLDTSASLQATVNPAGQEVFNCHFEYGTSAAYGADAPCSPLPASGGSPVPVSAALTGLAANTIYHFRVVAAGGGGVAYGSDVTLATAPDPPTVLTGAAAAITREGATLGATVNPLGQAVTDCRFEYGLTSGYEASVPCGSSPGSGSEPVGVSGQPTGMAEFRTYHYRVSATNATGTAHGADRTFNTLSDAPEYGGCGPLAGGRYTSGGCTKWGGGRYEWHPQAAGGRFTLTPTSAAVLIETVGHAQITCRGASGLGEYAGRDALGGVTLTLTGCEYAGRSCTSALAPEGQLATAPLEGLLGVVQLGRTAAADKLGLELRPTGGAPFAAFSCGLQTVLLRGAVIAPVTADLMLASTTLHLSATRGRQHPERFAAQGMAVLEASFGGGPFQQAGVSLEASWANAEPVEANSVA